MSAAVSLTHRVPDKVKKQIWANEYVDFALLLNSSLTQSDDHYTFKVDKGEGGKPALILAPNPKRQTVQSIEQWVSAFQVFVAIYSEKAPHDTPALRKYGSVIRELASQGANWRFYDGNFRTIRQTQGAPWDQIHAKLWLRCHYFRAKPSTQPSKSKQNGQYIPKGFAGNFIGESHALGVATNTSVFAVGTPTLFRNVNQPPSSLLRIQGPNHLLLPPKALPTVVCPSKALPTPVKAERLAAYLTGYEDNLRKHLLSGFLYGFRLHYHGPLESSHSTNLVSASEHSDMVDQKLAKEIQAGRIMGPFAEPPLPNLKISPLGVIPQKVQGEFRMIHHLSFPFGASVNDFIPPKFCSVQYARVDDAIRIIKCLGRGCTLAKTDVRSAFRIIPMHPLDYQLLGMQWKGKYYVDRCLPMGCASSCKTFEALSSAMEWVARNKLAIPNIIHILDDFLILEASHEACGAGLQRFLHFCKDIGVPMASDKTESPSQVLTFAGIELDCLNLEARLPMEKVDKILGVIRSHIPRKRVKLKEIQSLIGLLNFACSVITPGRVFIRRLINLTVGVRRAHHSIRVTMETKRDLRLWETFLASFNGKSFFLDEAWLTSVNLKVYTDAAQSRGYGIIFGKHWAYGTWPDAWKTHNICFLEFFPIVVALSTWCRELRNKRVLFFYR